MLARRVMGGVLAVGTWTISKVLVGALVAPILARMLGTDGYGQWSFYLALLFLATPPANLGTAQALIRSLAERPDEPARAQSLVRFLASVQLVGVLLGTAVIAIFTVQTRPAPGGSEAIVLIIAGIFIFDQGCFLARGILYGLHRESQAALPASAGAVLGSLATVVFVVAGFGLEGALAGVLLGNLSIAVVTLSLARRALGPPEVVVPLEAAERKALLRFGLSSMVFMSVNMILYKSSVVLVGLILQDDRQTGLLATALQLSEFVWVIPIAIEGVMIQSTAVLWKKGGTLEIEHLTARLVRYTSVLVLGILVPMLVLGDHVLALYFGEGFVPAAHALRILIPGVFSYSLSRVIYPVLQSKGTVIVMVVVTTGAAVFNIAGYLLVVPRWGIAGGAVVTSVAYGMVIVFYARLLRRVGVAVFSGFRPGGQVVASLAAAAAAALATMMFTGHLVVVLAGFSASALLYVAAVFRLGVLSVREMESLVVSLPDAVRGKVERIVRWCSPWLLMLEGDKRAP